MALVTIIIQDGADGNVSFGVSAEPALPRTILDGKPTKAQAAASQEVRSERIAMHPDGGTWAAESETRTLADRLDAMADNAPTGSQQQSDLYAAATVWRKHLNGDK